jgi:hypothetical protein
MRRSIWISLHQNATINLDFASSKCDDRFGFRFIKKKRRPIWISLDQNSTIDLNFALSKLYDRVYQSSLSFVFQSSPSLVYQRSLSLAHQSRACYRSSITIITKTMALTCPCTRLLSNNCGDIIFGIDVLNLNAHLAPLTSIRYAGSATLLALLARRRVPTMQRV